MFTKLIPVIALLFIAACTPGGHCHHGHGSKGECCKHCESGCCHKGDGDKKPCAHNPQ